MRFRPGTSAATAVEFSVITAAIAIAIGATVTQPGTTTGLYDSALMWPAETA
jgi:Flp pilus assembly pilin Flp